MTSYVWLISNAGAVPRSRRYYGDVTTGMMA